MDNHIPIVEHKPALLGPPLDAPPFFVILFGCFQHAFSERVQHAVAGTVANHEIICKGCDVLDVQKQDVFALFVLQGIDYFMSKFESVQISPLSYSVIASVLSGAAVCWRRRRRRAKQSLGSSGVANHVGDCFVGLRPPRNDGVFLLSFLRCRAKTSLQTFQTFHHAKVTTVMRQKDQQVQADQLDLPAQFFIDMLIR